MQIPKEQILEFLRSRGNHDQAEQASGELPEQVDPQQDAGLLQKFGIDPQQLLSGALGGNLGGLGSKFGL